MELNLGRVVGSTWYSGSGITGNSTTPTKFPGSGVTKALADDMYLNVTGGDRGNVYRCSTGGDASTAEWVYVGSILGASPDVIDNLESTSTTKALSANQGKVLKDILDNAGLEPLVVTPTLGQESYTASLVIEDKTTTFTVTDMDDNTGTYSYTEQGGTTATVNITIGTSIGLPQSGAVIKSIASSDARIKSYALYDSASTEIFSETPSLWAHITDDEQNIIPSTNITDGVNTYKSGIISKIIDGVRTALYPITHAKAVWFSKTRNETVYDKIGYMDDNIAPTEVSPTENAYSVGDLLIYNNELYEVVAAIAIGESLTVGTNIEKKSVSQINSDLTWKSLGSYGDLPITLPSNYNELCFAYSWAQSTIIENFVIPKPVFDSGLNINVTHDSGTHGYEVAKSGNTIVGVASYATNASFIYYR